MITIPTLTEIRDQILSDIESATGQTAPLLPKAVWRVLATALAGALVLLYRFGAWAYRQIFTLTADDEGLYNKAVEYGMTRTPAVQWIGTATATGDDDTVITAGTLWSYNNYVYEVQTAVTVSGGQAAMTLKSLESGDALNLDNATIINLVSPQAGLDSTATVTSTTQAGEDQESIADFRTRILARQQNKPQGGAAPDYVSWSLEIAGIKEAFAFRPIPGFVNVYPLTDDPDPVNRIPDAAKLTEVQDYLQDTKRRPLNATVSALAFKELDFDIDIANLSPNDATTKSNIETAIKDYLYERRPQQYDDEANPKNIISAGEITARAITAGADICTVTLKNAGGTAITFYTLQDSELSVLRTLTWV